MTTTFDKSFVQSIIRMVDSLASSGNYDTVINILSLLCLFSILNRSEIAQNAVPTPVSGGTAQAAGTNPLQKMLGDLTKGDGGGGSLASILGGALGSMGSGSMGSPDMLMSLLPLLNNPQIKSKITPTNIASVMGMLNNLGVMGGGNAAAPEPPKPKPEKKTADAEVEPKPVNNPPTPAPPPEPTPMPTAEQPKAAAAAAMEESEPDPALPETRNRRAPGRFLNWKTSF